MSEIAVPETAAPAIKDLGLTLEEKVDYLFHQAAKVETLLDEAGPQVTALLAQAGPMLESLAPLLGQASSPMGRIFGSLIR